ncbi:unnamed protein product [Orchesella dallaii]|uniref:Uncharacterized protein n=1 Tax=Orchesella dallaii TaxID=48710 RepID=A0ABP1RUV8_9HEXA
MLGLLTCYTIESDVTYLAQITTEVLWAGGIKYKGSPSPLRIPQFPEMFGYITVTGFYCIPIVIAVFPIFRNYDPFSLLLENVHGISELARSVISSAASGIFALAALPAISNEIMLMASGIVVFGKLLRDLEKINKNEASELYQERIDWFQSLIMKLRKKSPVSKTCVGNSNELERDAEERLSSYPMWFDRSRSQ